MTPVTGSIAIARDAMKPGGRSWCRSMTLAVDPAHTIARIGPNPGTGRAQPICLPAPTPTIMLSAIVAHTAWHWLTDRYATLRQYRFEWPTIDALFLVNAMRWAMVIVALAGLWWLMGVLRQTRVRGEDVRSADLQVRSRGQA